MPLKQTSKSGRDLYLHLQWLTSDFHTIDTVTVAKWLTLLNKCHLWIAIVGPTDKVLIALVQHFIFFQNSLRYAGVGNYENRILWSLIGEFNQSQSEAGKDGCSNASSHNWLKNIDQSTHQEDYCETCTEIKGSISSQQTTINHKNQFGGTLPDELKKLEDELNAMKKIGNAKEAHE